MSAAQLTEKSKPGTIKSRRGMSAATVAAASGSAIHTAIIHPIVLLSVVDHYTREAVQTQRRVIGVLLGSVKDGVVDVTNCYAGALASALQRGALCPFRPKKTCGRSSRPGRAGGGTYAARGGMDGRELL